MAHRCRAVPNVIGPIKDEHLARCRCSARLFEFQISVDELQQELEARNPPRALLISKLVFVRSDEPAGLLCRFDLRAMMKCDRVTPYSRSIAIDRGAKVASLMMDMIQRL